MSKLASRVVPLLIAAGLVLSAVPFMTQAQTTPTPTPTPAPVIPGTPTTGFTSCDSTWTTGGVHNLGNVITFYICVANRYVTVIAVFIMIVVGMLYIIGGFKPDMASTAKTIFGTTIVGLIFMYLISFIINILAFGGILSKT